MWVTLLIYCRNHSGHVKALYSLRHAPSMSLDPWVLPATIQLCVTSSSHNRSPLQPLTWSLIIPPSIQNRTLRLSISNRLSIKIKLLLCYTMAWCLLVKCCQPIQSFSMGMCCQDQCTLQSPCCLCKAFFQMLYFRSVRCLEPQAIR